MLQIKYINFIACNCWGSEDIVSQHLGIYAIISHVTTEFYLYLIRLVNYCWSYSSFRYLILWFLKKPFLSCSATRFPVNMNLYHCSLLLHLPRCNHFVSVWTTIPFPVLGCGFWESKDQICLVHHCIPSA